MNILNKTEKQKILENLEKFGIKMLPYILTQTGKEKIRAFSGNLTPEEIKKLHNYIYIETIGLYMAKIEEDGLRLSLDGTHILKPNKNIIELNEEQAEKWMKGEDLSINELQEQIKNKSDFIVIKSGEDFLGCGKIGKDKLINFIPKERRRK